MAINEAHKGVVAEAIEIKVDWCVGGDAELGEKVVVFKNEKGHGIFAIGFITNYKEYERFVKSNK